ncbi:MAG: FAD:protein FMN transferase [Aquabacterium sp.]|nr:FAD:protein FMN transferase [Ferruginibacter sp.]
MFVRIFTAVLLLMLSVHVWAQPKRYSFAEPKMGSPFTIILYANDSMQATTLARQSFSLVDSFANIFSDYLDSSELSKLSASASMNAAPVRLSTALLEILVASKTAFEKSGGAFDITVGPLIKLWRKARKTKVFPTKEMVLAAQQSTGFKSMVIDTINKTATLTKPGMQLDLGGIAQGYIAQKVIDFLSAYQVSNALVNASGDIVVSGAPPETQGWVVGVNLPESKEELLPQKLLLQYKAVTTSGDAYQYMDHEGKRYSHITDPRTGYGVTYQRNVTVIAADGTTADWLATACSILTIKKAKRLATQMQAEVLITAFKKGRLKMYATKGFAQYFKHPQQ